MADPTNVSVPPAKPVDPLNVGVPVHGSKFPSGATGFDLCHVLSQGSDLADNLTTYVVDSFIAPCKGYFRLANYQSMAATDATFDLYNATTSTTMVSAVTPVAGTAGAVSYAAAAAQTVAESDEIQLRVTTLITTGVIKGLNLHVLFTPLAGSATNPV